MFTKHMGFKLKGWLKIPGLAWQPCNATMVLDPERLSSTHICIHVVVKKTIIPNHLRTFPVLTFRSAQELLFPILKRFWPLVIFTISDPNNRQTLVYPHPPEKSARNSLPDFGSQSSPAPPPPPRSCHQPAVDNPSRQRRSWGRKPNLWTISRIQTWNANERSWKHYTRISHLQWSCCQRRGENTLTQHRSISVKTSIGTSPITFDQHTSVALQDLFNKIITWTRPKILFNVFFRLFPSSASPLPLTKMLK